MERGIDVKIGDKISFLTLENTPSNLDVTPNKIFTVEAIRKSDNEDIDSLILEEYVSYNYFGKRQGFKNWAGRFRKLDT